MNDNHTESRRTPFQERVLYLGAFPLGHCAVDWVTGAIWILGPAIAAALGLAPSRLGLLFSVKTAGAAIAYLPAGLVGHSIRYRGQFLMSTFWWVAFAYVGASIVRGYWPLAILLAVGAAGAASWHPVAMGTMVEQMPRHRGFVIAMHGAGGTLAGVLAPFTVGFLLAFMDWQDVLRVSVLPTVLVGILFLRLGWMVPHPSQTLLNRTDLALLFKTLWLRRSLGILIVLGLHGMSVTALQAMTPLYLQETHRISSGLTGMAYAAMVLAGAAAGPFLGGVSDRLGRKPVALVALLGGSGFALLLSLGSGAPSLLPSMVVAGMLLLGIKAVLMATALEVIGKQETAVLGFLFLAGSGGEVLGALLAGLVGDIDLRFSLALVAALALMGGALVSIHPFTAMSARSFETR